mmetsp:Transcript_11075/g.30962  ORF Transcript_11075/g.30962 Transcript_11075/m.30962 type:complete len:333 (-) Transcript_11075:82-1080(-)
MERTASCGGLAGRIGRSRRLASMMPRTASLGVRLRSMWFGLATCAAALTFTSAASSKGHDYGAVFSKERDVGIKFADLPGFTRSVVERDHALITPESRVWSGTPGWQKTSTAHLITPSFPMGAELTMYLADMATGGVFKSDEKEQMHLERFVFVVEGSVSINCADGPLTLKDDDFAFFPPGYKHEIINLDEAKLVVYERQHFYSTETVPAFHSGSTSDKPILPVPGEIFKLRKCLPEQEEYDFNIHVMDFEPGEFLNIKEVHYNQHGLLLLEGQGIYRLGERWYSVQAGDAIWMAPFVPQWFGALGKKRSRYILYKDTYRSPGHLMTGGAHM